MIFRKMLRLFFSCRSLLFVWTVVPILTVLASPPPTWKLSRKGGWLFPIHPGKPASLTGNMGEIRSNHFHGGLDIRTGWASGVPVRAAKGGYISRVSIAGEGYGNTLFLTHPDGFVTVYAHLEKLSGPLHTFVKNQQYKARYFAVELTLAPGQFPVQQGDTIAISGNTGSSRGPHLHFEIRDTAGTVYNPLAFGFEEVRDKLSPVVDRLAIVPLEPSSRVDGTFNRREIPVREAGLGYVSTETPVVSGYVGLEIKARDRISNGTSNGGIFCIEVYANNNLIYYHNLNTFPISKTNHVNQLLNYRHFRLHAEKFQKLYMPDGYFQTRHTPADQHGKLFLAPGQEINLEIWLWDVAGNKRICKARLKGAKAEERPSTSGLGLATRIQHDIWDNTLVLKCNGLDQAGSAQIRLHKKNQTEGLEPSWRDGNQLFYTYDLRKGLPDSAVSPGTVTKPFAFVRSLLPKQTGPVLCQGFSFQMGENSLFDTLHLEAAKDPESGIIQLGSSLWPLADYFTLSQPVAGSDNKSVRGFAEALSGVFSKPLFTETSPNHLSCNSKYLGRFKWQKDSTAPKIRMGVCQPQSARFEIYDNLSGIESFEATLNGSFLLMIWDKKKHLIYSDPLPGQLPMRGEFVLKVRDFSGNVQEFRKNIP